MPSKKLTKQKREELKAKKNNSNQSSLLFYFLVIIISVAVITAAFIFLMPEDEKKIKDEEATVNENIYNQPPVANYDYITVEKNSTNNYIDVLADDNDEERDNITIINIENPDGGNASIFNDTILYNPDINFTGYDIFSYTISDGENSASAKIAVFVYNKTDKDEANPLAFIKTSKGTIAVELYGDEAPKTVENFINYADDGFYDGLVFHRVIDDFMIQGGGFFPDGSEKDTNDPIDLEIHSDLRHVDGAIAMARTSNPDSATSQFFINDGAQPQLEPGGVDSNGYAVFGVTIDGLDVVRSIASVETTTKNNMQDWPVNDVLINSVKIVEPEK